MGILNRLFGRRDALQVDARRIYKALMAQSRQPNFFGAGRFPDNYDGRVDVLTLHIAAVLSNLNKFEQNGERLGQALFDEMKDDFEIALREEALSDAGVKKRIQPMISLFYDRVKKYVEGLNSDKSVEALRGVFEETLTDDAISDDSQTFVAQMVDYLIGFDDRLSNLSIGQIALTDFSFPILSV